MFRLWPGGGLPGIVFLTWALASAGYSQSLLGNHQFPKPGNALIDASVSGRSLLGAQGDASAMAPSRGSLFSDRREGGLFAPWAERDTGFGRRALGSQSFSVAGLKALIARAEAGPKGYDAIHYSAKRLPARPPTQLTVAEIEAWIRATPGQHHAIGRYQLIPPTFRRLMRSLDAPPSAVFTPALQDAAAMVLFEEAGLQAFLDGKMSQTGFMNNLAKIWAGLPNSSGKSHYHGHAGNKAVISWGQFKSNMDKLFPSG